MRILVTGGCGFIGSAVCRRLAAQPALDVVNLDLLTYAADPRSVAVLEASANYFFIKGDVRNTALVLDILQRHAIDAVIHLAAESHVDRSIEGPGAFLDTNIMGTYGVLQAVRAWLDGAGKLKRDSFRLVHVSTDEVFGDLAEDEPAFTEESPYRPSSPYAASKAASDHLVRSWHRTFGVPAIVTNCSNNYGPYQFPEKLIPLVTLNAISGKPLPVYGDGANIRDWLYVEDHALALEKVLFNGAAGETFAIGGNCERRNIDVVRGICTVLDELRPLPGSGSYHDLISFVTDRPGHDRRYAINASRIEKRLGWQPEHDFNDGLRQTLNWYLSHEDWWRPLLERSAVR